MDALEYLMRAVAITTHLVFLDIFEKIPQEGNLLYDRLLALFDLRTEIVHMDVGSISNIIRLIWIPKPFCLFVEH